MFLTFGGGSLRWRGAAWRLARQARRTEVFAAVVRITDRDLRRSYPTFWDEHGSFVRRHRRTYGYGLWKPFLVKELMSEYGSEISGILYVDAGCELNSAGNALNRLREYLALGEAKGFLGMELAASLASWCKPEALAFFDLEDSEGGIPVVAGGIVAFANNSLGRAVVQEWWDSATALESCLLTDDRRGVEAAAELVAHPYDQALLSCIVAKYGLHTIQDETYFSPNWRSDGREFPIWAMRNSLPVSVKPGTMGALMRRLRNGLRAHRANHGHEA